MRPTEIDDFEDFLLSMESREIAGTVKLAEKMLAKLNVAELRVLMAHYTGGKPDWYADLGKPDLIGEVAPEYARDHLSAA